MRRQLPSDEQVKNEMITILEGCETAGRRATVTAVERALDIPHATFARNYPQLIEWFKTALAQSRQAARSRPPTSTAADPEEVHRRLRTENSELRKIVNIYAAEIQRLTHENAELTAALNDRASIRVLHPRQHAHTENTSGRR